LLGPGMLSEDSCFAGASCAEQESGRHLGGSTSPTSHTYGCFDTLALKVLASKYSLSVLNCRHLCHLDQTRTISLFGYYHGVGFLLQVMSSFDPQASDMMSV
jgi:hypothetical protein